MEGGCSIPSFALATLTEAGDVRLHGGIVSLSGEEYVERTPNRPRRAGRGPRHGRGRLRAGPRRRGHPGQHPRATGLAP
ncbi:MAG: hypothetical protein WKG07_24705 [Hymenobacter sp.]